MRLILARIDDRFIHGQVTVGWGQRLRPDLIILASDEIAGDPWQTRVYCSAVPRHMAVSVLGLSDTAAMVRSSADRPDRKKRAILLTGSPADMHTLVTLGASFERVNVGGMHFSSGKVELVPSIFVDGRDLHEFHALIDNGVRLVAQAVPGGRELVIDEAMLSAAETRL